MTANFKQVTIHQQQGWIQKGVDMQVNREIEGGGGSNVKL